MSWDSSKWDIDNWDAAEVASWVWWLIVVLTVGPLLGLALAQWVFP